LPDYCTGSGEPWRVSDRLTEADIQAMIERYQAGEATKPALAEQYKVSLSTVKRILARHGVRKYPKPPR
jgi:DNA-binding MarR family transcriptional regulator